ncbi:MAG: RDD family protein [Lachnospiraceae bacterium]|nr:RDD family protein [Lachnospiraceae bacterium]
MIFDLQKASMWKRMSAFLLDFILLVIAVAGIALLLSTVLGFDKHNAALNEAYAKYEAEYGVVFDISQEEFMQKTEAEQRNWNNAYQALIKDTEAVYSYNMVLNLTLVISTLAILFAYLVLEFFVPIKFGNGQTLGKKIFGVAVMRTDGVKVTAPLMFIRTILGKFTIETMIPVLIGVMIFFNMIGIVGMLILGLILLLQIILMITTHTNSCIHDVLAKTVAVELASQMIFENEQEMIAYKNKVHAEKVARQTY